MDESPRDEQLGSGLVFEDTVPLRVKPAGPGDAPDHSERQRSENVLRMILGLDEHRADLPEDEAEIAGELQRLDFKINLLMDLVGQLLSRTLDLPPAMPLRLGARRLEWSGPAPAGAGRLRVELYADLRYPRPLVLTGAAVAADELAQGWSGIVLDDPGPVLQDLIEKFIFRQHRRRVAESRRSARRAGDDA